MNPVPGTDEPVLGTVWSKRTGRRTFLKGAAMAGAATLAVPLLGRTSASAATQIIYGANHDYYTDWTGYVSGNNGPNPPAAWHFASQPGRKELRAPVFRRYRPVR